MTKEKKTPTPDKDILNCRESFEKWYADNISSTFADEHKNTYNDYHAVFGFHVLAAFQAGYQAAYNHTPAIKCNKLEVVREALLAIANMQEDKVYSDRYGTVLEANRRITRMQNIADKAISLSALESAKVDENRTQPCATPVADEVEEIAYKLFMALGGMLSFYGMDLEKDHAIQNITHDKAVIAQNLYREWCKKPAPISAMPVVKESLTTDERTKQEAYFDILADIHRYQISDNIVDLCWTNELIERCRKALQNAKPITHPSPNNEGLVRIIDERLLELQAEYDIAQQPTSGLDRIARLMNELQDIKAKCLAALRGK